MNHSADERGANSDSPPRNGATFGAADSPEAPDGLLDLDSVVMGRREAGRDELIERLCNDQVRRWRAGHRVPAESYLSRHPRLHDDEEAVFELIYGEYLLREELGEPPSLEEWRWRFPRYADRLRRQVDLHEVLRLDDRVPAEFPDEPAVGASTTSHRRAPIIAPGYQILGELGRGGMGAVYKAWQIRLKRVVALKVIRPGAYADARAAERFQAEAEAAARFQHPNIVQVYEVGEHDGMGYLVLEYVAGGGLDRRISESLQDPRATARLIEILARATHYAHQGGIIHRDLKPANVLLTEDGVPKITDFGLAKLQEREEGLTGQGEILGTPSYMAPEQVRGLSDRIGPATDVYSLGAILYESLTGRPPFKGTTPLSTLEQVTSQEPLSPGRLQRHLPRDLETICLKCLEKDASRRYPTAWELAEDLRRFNAGQPILARPTPAWERLWKWARRRPGIAAAGGGLVVLSVLLMGGGLYYQHRLRHEMFAAREAGWRASVNAEAAVEQRNLALKALKQLIYDVQEKLGKTPATRSLRRSLLDSAIRGLEEIGRSTAGAPPDLSQAVAHQKLADIFRVVGRWGAARQHYGRALAIADELQAGDGDGVTAVDDVRYLAEIGLGLVEMSAQDYEQANRRFRRAVELAESIASTSPDRPDARRDLIEAYLQLGRSFSFSRDYDNAEIWFRRMHDEAERWISQHPEENLARNLLASAYRKLGDLRKFARDFEGARRDYTMSIEIGRRLLQAEPGNHEFKSNLAIAIDDMAGVAREERHLEEARTLAEEAEHLCVELAAADPENIDARSRLLHTRQRSAMIDRDAGRYPEAARKLRLIRGEIVASQAEGLADGRRAVFAEGSNLDLEIAVCDAAPRAVDDLDFARSRPPAAAARLLLIHGGAMAGGDASPRLIPAARALLGLEARSVEDLLEVSRALASLLSRIDSGRWNGTPPVDLASLRDRCADRAVALLTRAVNVGFRDLARLKGDELAVLRPHREFQSLVARLERTARSAEAVKTSE